VVLHCMGAANAIAAANNLAERGDRPSGERFPFRVIGQHVVRAAIQSAPGEHPSLGPHRDDPPPTNPSTSARSRAEQRAKGKSAAGRSQVGLEDEAYLSPGDRDPSTEPKGGWIVPTRSSAGWHRMAGSPPAPPSSPGRRTYARDRRPMIDVEYTREMVEMEPGPNFYWRLTPPDYLRLLQDLHALAVVPGVEVRPRRLGYIDVLGGYEITLRSSARGKYLIPALGP
jgi:hypothetical protein